nr:hypothetical protein [Tanacetum cinerariifolium]
QLVDKKLNSISAKSFFEEARQLILCVDIIKFDHPILNLLLDKVVSDVDIVGNKMLKSFTLPVMKIPLLEYFSTASEEVKNTENLNTKISKLNEEVSDCENLLYHYKLGLSHVKARLVEFKTQEIKFCEKIRGLEIDVEFRNNKIEYLVNELEQVKKEKEGLDNKLTCFESALKDLDTLLGSQRSDKNKEGLRYNAVPPSYTSLLTF